MTTQRIGRLLCCVALILSPAACGSPSPRPAATAANQPQIIDAELLNATDGWARTDDALVTTHDAGQSWTAASVPAPSGTYVARFSTSIAGAAAQLRAPMDSASVQTIAVSITSDGGHNWHPTATITGPPDPLSGVSIDFLDASHGWILAPAMTSSAFSRAYLYRTSDGGQSWTPARAPANGVMSFASDLEGWLVGGPDRPHLFQTLDGGLTWRESMLPAYAGTRSPIVGIPLAVGPASWLLARATDSTAEIFLSKDDGTTWQRLSQITGIGKPAISLLDGANWFVGFDDELRVTADAGATWPRRPPAPAGSLLRFRTPKVGWALESHGECRSFKADCHRLTQLVGTTDGGKTWSRLRPP